MTAALIEAATARLKVAGVVKPRREAHRLWAWMNRSTPGKVLPGREGDADPGVARAYQEAVARRAGGEPIAYVLGTAGFRNLELLSDHRALIPRPETETLVDHALARVQSGRALDVGTGTGCLALALAQEGSFSEVVATDISEPALALAAENVSRTGLAVRLLQSDLGQALAGEQFDLVVSNPPYLTDAEYEALDVSVKEWEPRLALASGGDGLDATRRLLVEARGLLSPGGCLVVELDSSRSGEAARLANVAGFCDVSVLDDLFGRPRYLIARQGLRE